MEILPLLNWDEIEPKWILGYSDSSTLLFALTLKTGIATAHGTNFIDLRSDEWDPVTSKFLDVLSASKRLGNRTAIIGKSFNPNGNTLHHQTHMFSNWIAIHIGKYLVKISSRLKVDFSEAALIRLVTL